MSKNTHKLISRFISDECIDYNFYNISSNGKRQLTINQIKKPSVKTYIHNNITINQKDLLEFRKEINAAIDETIKLSLGAICKTIQKVLWVYSILCYTVVFMQYIWC